MKRYIKKVYGTKQPDPRFQEWWSDKASAIAEEASKSFSPKNKIRHIAYGRNFETLTFSMNGSHPGETSLTFPIEFLDLPVNKASAKLVDEYNSLIDSGAVQFRPGCRPKKIADLQ